MTKVVEFSCLYETVRDSSGRTIESGKTIWVTPESESLLEDLLERQGKDLWG